MKPKLISKFLVLFLALGTTSSAQLSLSTLFSDHMVLQRDQAFTIFGKATPNMPVSVHMDDKSFKTKSSPEGVWQVNMSAQPVGVTKNIVITSAGDSLFLHDVVFGDVWICGGQSNMEWPISQTNYSVQEKDTLLDIRIIDVALAMDYMPQDSIKGGQWEKLTIDNIKAFSAVGFHFGKYVHLDENVPIGLISVNLGATAIEPWMPNEALNQFDQFQPEVGPIIQSGKSFIQLEKDFEKIQDAWEKEYSHTGPGMLEKWYLPDTDLSDWDLIHVPGFWEEQGYPDFDGVMWYRKEFDLPANFNQSIFQLSLNQIDDYDITWVNGHEVGRTYGRHNHRNYAIPDSILKPTGNVLVVRVFDTDNGGGFSTAPFWMSPMVKGKWLAKKGLAAEQYDLDPVFLPNHTPFSSPGVLYNGNIAPLTRLPIKGAIWYQGESNENRAYEYRDLLPAMINSWRKAWNQAHFPFLIVQLANHHAEPQNPGPSNWAELREAQFQATSLSNVGIINTIDIGEAFDIHPKNKEEVGRRLSLVARNIAYDQTIVDYGPVYDSVNINGNQATVYFKDTPELVKTGTLSYINGFQVAGPDRKFYWAPAQISGNTVLVSSRKVYDIRAIRYNWSDNPGEVNLYNSAGLPAFPFRTDQWKGATYAHQFDHTKARF